VLLSNCHLVSTVRKLRASRGSLRPPSIEQVFKFSVLAATSSPNIHIWQCRLQSLKALGPVWMPTFPRKCHLEVRRLLSKNMVAFAPKATYLNAEPVILSLCFELRGTRQNRQKLLVVPKNRSLGVFWILSRFLALPLLSRSLILHFFLHLYFSAYNRYHSSVYNIFRNYDLTETTWVDVCTEERSRTCRG